MRHIEIPAKQLSCKIRVSMRGIEEIYAIAKLIPLVSKGRDLLLARSQLLLRLTPGKQAAGPDKCPTRHREQRHQRKRLGKAFLGQFRIVMIAMHERNES